VITLEKVVSEVTAVGKTKRKLIGGTATRLRTIVVVAADFPVLMWEQISDYYHHVTWLLLLVGGSVEDQMRDTDELWRVLVSFPDPPRTFKPELGK